MPWLRKDNADPNKPMLLVSGPAESNRMPCPSTMIYPSPLLHLKLKARAVIPANAAHVIVDQPVPQALQVMMDTMVSTVLQANQEIVAHQLPAVPIREEGLKSNAHAKLHPVMLAPLDQEDPMAPQAMVALQVPMDNQAPKAHVDHPAQLAVQDKMVAPDQQAHLVPPDLVVQVTQVQPDQMDTPVPQVQAVNPVVQEKMAVPAVQALPEMLVPQAVPATLAALVALETQAEMVPQAVANIAHQLVWLQVIKRSHQTHSQHR